jgi:hypothetical protein
MSISTWFLWRKRNFLRHGLHGALYCCLSICHRSGSNSLIFSMFCCNVMTLKGSIMPYFLNVLIHLQHGGGYVNLWGESANFEIEQGDLICLVPIEHQNLQAYVEIVYYQDDKMSIRYILSIKPWLEQLIIVLDGATFRTNIWQSRIIMFTYFYIGGSIVTFPNIRLLGWISKEEITTKNCECMYEYMG